MIKIVLVIWVILLGHSSVAIGSDILFKEGSLIHFAPPIINKDYYLIEYGFIVQKRIDKWKLDYNAFVNASLFEDWKGRSDNLRAGALGFKGGVLFPLLDRPFFYRVAGGFGKSVLHKNPVWGKEEQTVAKKNMFLFEIGFVYRFEPTFLTLTYQKTNVRFLERNLFVGVGVNY